MLLENNYFFYLNVPSWIVLVWCKVCADKVRSIQKLQPTTLLCVAMAFSLNNKSENYFYLKNSNELKWWKKGTMLSFLFTFSNCVTLYIESPNLCIELALHRTGETTFWCWRTVFFHPYIIYNSEEDARLNNLNYYQIEKVFSCKYEANLLLLP